MRRLFANAYHAAMPERPELGQLLTRLTRTVIDRELPILQRHGLSMWEYVILSALRRAAAPTQAELSATTGRDKTRLIGNLDRLHEAGLIRRDPDPQDRRNRVVTLTTAGTQTHRSCHREITAMERDLLAALPASDRRAFEGALVTLLRACEPET